MTKLIFALGLLITSLGNAQEANQFKAFFSSFNSLSANFQQSSYNDTGVLLESTTGHLQFQRPQQLVWQTHTPNKQTLLLNQNELWLIDFDLEQASLQPSTNLEETPLYWLINRPQAIKNLPDYTHTQDGMDWYTTDQKNALRFGFQNNVLRSISLTNELGQLLVLTFSKLALNPNIDKNTFDLNLNSAFDVIR